MTNQPPSVVDQAPTAASGSTAPQPVPPSSSSRLRPGGAWLGRPGWGRVLRNATVGYFEQAGSRMAAALAYYSIFVGGPVLVLTLLLGSTLFGEETTRDAVARILLRMLPPSAEAAGEVARQMVRGSLPTASLALLAGLTSLFGFTRALATILNVTLRAEGTEPFYRPFLLGPLLVVAVLGLLWGSWAFRFLIELLEASTSYTITGLTGFLLETVIPLVLATLHFAIILAVVPRVHLSRPEILVPAALGALLWEGVRYLLGWLLGSDSPYLHLFGPLGGVVALLAWVYVNSIILVVIGQLTWAYAMERRGRGRSAALAPREAGLHGWIRPYHGDNAVNEDA